MLNFAKLLIWTAAVTVLSALAQQDPLVLRAQRAWSRLQALNFSEFAPRFSSYGSYGSGALNFAGYFTGQDPSPSPLFVDPYALNNVTMNVSAKYGTDDTTGGCYIFQPLFYALPFAYRNENNRAKEARTLNTSRFLAKQWWLLRDFAVNERPQVYNMTNRTAFLAKLDCIGFESGYAQHMLNLVLDLKHRWSEWPY
jgi:hypothetical protein